MQYHNIIIPRMKLT